MTYDRQLEWQGTENGTGMGMRKGRGSLSSRNLM